ncbi:MAG: methionine synthase [Actinomycetota bacterium]|nr:methionine synthase [Actinomycetota bacterium]
MTSVDAAYPWPAGSATGVGSLPGTDVREATRLVLGELPDLPHLPELPARGPGADLVGRAAALLVDLHVDLQPAGWRLVDKPGRDERRARSYLEQDLDALEEAAEGYAGPLKVQVAGPWTLAATLEVQRGDKVLGDAGATRDLAASLAEGIGGHVAAVRRRVPGAEVVLQLDEPSLPTVLAGAVRTASGYGTFRTVEEVRAQDTLRRVVETAGVPVIAHCCAPGAPVTLFRRAGAAAVSIDLALHTSGADERVGELVDAGLGLLLGVVPSTGDDLARLSEPSVTVGPVRRLWRRLGFPAEQLPSVVVPTPACGLAAATPAYARAALRACREAGRRLAEDPEGS